MPDPINLSISYITNVDVSNNLQNLNNALIAAKTTNLEEQVKKQKEAQSQVKNTEEKSESQNINNNQKRNTSEYKGKKRKNNKETKKENIVVDDYRGHSLDVRI
ncbi:hypothetical protein SAMN02745164_01329 [Marinitoga hydrogenitolerans DSM 16785]|uniref:Uncharacterized protein n=1 Tax=Marinitoga hydrogenitolerans (strain DSM 16785 / JCM 12826 / AT1271) TaxID=1122195 RepID=A0A1M4X4S5_MARH1|nr:hypothetical protein [Marinitoga hydrogenitolerans]SHE88353.1 hypothetical protein SAMN02745164_01329 [Marinitoga hydrogenitolerans DSM 16785]